MDWCQARFYALLLSCAWIGARHDYMHKTRGARFYALALTSLEYPPDRFPDLVFLIGVQAQIPHRYKIYSYI